MAKEIDLGASASIISIASKYIIASVILVAIGAISLVYAVITYLVYGTSIIYSTTVPLASGIAIFIALFVGLASIAIGGFLTLWGLYWLRSEGKRLKSKPNKIADQVYNRIEWYATRFIIVSIVGVVIGVAAIIYGSLAYYFIVANPLALTIESSFKTPFQDLSVFLGSFIGIGSLAASLVLWGWGIFWRRKVENRGIL
ncbi:MAG: hypothetical protein WED07_13555 [Candidatus Freyarchaeum deiterrae]